MNMGTFYRINKMFSDDNDKKQTRLWMMNAVW